MQLNGWRKRIEKAKVNGAFSEADKAKAHNWKSCAIGERYKLLSKSLWSLEEKEKEMSLGFLFMHEIDKGNVKEAEHVLTKIEALD